MFLSAAAYAFDGAAAPALAWYEDRLSGLFGHHWSTRYQCKGRIAGSMKDWLKFSFWLVLFQVV